MGVVIPDDKTRQEMEKNTMVIDAFKFYNAGLKGELDLREADSIESFAYAANQLETLTFSQGDVVIKEGAFSRNALKVLDLSKSANLKLGQHSFSFNKIKELSLPENCSEIPNFCFMDNEIESLTIPESVKDIMSRAFYNNKIKNLVIKGTPRIADDAFAENPLTKITYKGVTFPGSLLNEQGDGYALLTRMDIIATYCARGFVPSEALLAETYKRGHNLFRSLSLSEENINRLCDEFKEYPIKGMLNCELEYNDNIKAELKKLFLKEFHVAPKILNELAIVATQFFISPETLVKAFHIENTQYFLKKEHPILEGILAEVVLPKDNFKKFIEKPYIFDLIQCYLKYVKTKDIGYKNTIDWIIKHPNINNTFINTLLEQAKNMKEIKDTMTLNEVSMEIARYQNLGEIAKIEQRYKDADFKFSDCVFNLKYTEAETEKYKAEFLKAGDTRMVTLGYDTNCCQHLDGAGESAMMYGLTHPEAGFWVITNKTNGKIVAQAEVWELNPDTLVFDNIEFAHNNLQTASDVKITDYKEIIGLWCANSKYNNIIMGMGYNEMAETNLDDYFPCDDVDVIPPLTAYDVFVLDKEEDDEFDSIDEIDVDSFSREDMDEYGPYTDTEECVYLMKDRVLAKYFDGVDINKRMEVPDYDDR